MSKTNSISFIRLIFNPIFLPISVLLAVAIPNLELFISLFGALCLSALGLAFPAWFQMCTYWYQIKGSAKVWLVVKNSFIVIVGLLGLVVGTTTSLSEIIRTFTEGEQETH